MKSNTFKVTTKVNKEVKVLVQHVFMEAELSRYTVFVGLTMATSAWKICLMNLFLDEWTSWMMSVWRLSRFFSRNPGGRTERRKLKG